MTEQRQAAGREADTGCNAFTCTCRETLTRAGASSPSDSKYRLCGSADYAWMR